MDRTTILLLGIVCFFATIIAACSYILLLYGFFYSWISLILFSGFCLIAFSNIMIQTLIWLLKELNNKTKKK